MPLKLVAPPAAEPVTLAEAKLHLRVDIADDDALIGSLVAAARQVAEAHQGRALLPQAWDLRLDRWPGADEGGEVRVPLAPLRSVASVKYFDPGGVEMTLQPSQYVVLDGTPGRIAPAPGACWPAAQCRRPGAITIRFEAGYDDAASVPEATKRGILLLVGHWYANREAVVTGTIAGELPLAVQLLLDADATGAYP